MMKKKTNTVLKFFLTLFVIGLMSSFALHKYYVSVFEISYENKKKQFEISARIFIDDFEDALYKKHKKHFYITTKEETKDANDFIVKYFEEKFKIKINNKDVKLSFLAKETEENVVICYFKIPYKTKIKNLQFSSSFLTEVFNEQQNLLHLNVLKTKKTILLDKYTTTETISL